MRKATWMKFNLKVNWIAVLLLTLVLAGCAVTLPNQGLPLPVTPAPATGSAAPAAATPSTAERESPDSVLSGVVFDANGTVAGATVRVKTTEIKTTTAANGSFALEGVTFTRPFTVTAWAKGYYVGWAGAVSNPEPITITLKPHYTTDNIDYDWFSFQGREGSESCALCHPAYDEWKADAHSQSAVNPRFLTMYTGSDVHGNQSPPNRFSAEGIQPPDLSQPYYGPGFKIDFLDSAGNCAACHTPLAAKAPLHTCSWSGCHTDKTASFARSVFPPQHQHQLEGINPVGLTGIAAEGIACEFCHKIGDVILDPASGLPYTGKPGILSMRLYRPEEGQQLFFGTFDDVTRRVSYLPLEEESAFCAPCHYGVFSAVDGMYGGTVVYNSFGEWLASAYSDPETGQTCQDCHMKPVDYDYFIFPDRGGLHRDPNRIHNHTMPGASDEELLQNSVTMTTTATRDGDAVVVAVSITNDKTGHDVPSGTPLRQMLLIVEARDADGNLLDLQAGPTLPDWTGDMAGRPGRTYAKILRDDWTGETPTAAYWRDISLVEDTRLAAFASDLSQYAFSAPLNGPVTVEARLIYRRAYQDLMEQKGWSDPDLLMESAALVVDG